MTDLFNKTSLKTVVVKKIDQTVCLGSVHFLHVFIVMLNLQSAVQPNYIFTVALSDILYKNNIWIFLWKHSALSKLKIVVFFLSVLLLLVFVSIGESLHLVQTATKRTF